MGRQIDRQYFPSELGVKFDASNAPVGQVGDARAMPAAGGTVQEGVDPCAVGYDDNSAAGMCAGQTPETRFSPCSQSFRRLHAVRNNMRTIGISSIELVAGRTPPDAQNFVRSSRTRLAAAAEDPADNFRRFIRAREGACIKSVPWLSPQRLSGLLRLMATNVVERNVGPALQLAGYVPIGHAMPNEGHAVALCAMEHRSLLYIFSGACTFSRYKPAASTSLTARAMASRSGARSFPNMRLL